MKKIFYTSVEEKSKVRVYIETGHELGKGADKEVVKAINLNGKQVALAIIKHKKDELAESIQKSDREFEVGGAFKGSKYFTQTLEYIRLHQPDGSFTDIHVIEFCGRGELTTYLKKEKLSGKQTINLFIQAIEGMIEAHKKGYIINDYKPENILIDDEGKLKIVDFGMFTEKNRLTFSHYKEGTIQYFPQEFDLVAKNKPQGTKLVEFAIKKDIFDLGMTLQTILSEGKQSPLVNMRVDGKQNWCEKKS